MDLSKLSLQYTVRKLNAEDVDSVYELASGNPMYYRYCPPFATQESILRDMKALPPRTTAADKFYIGFWEVGKLVAVMDLILNYPDTQTAFIGFFMMSREKQGMGIGSRIVQECFCCLKSLDYHFIRLGFAKGNFQSEAFWKKNGFEETGIETGVETENGGYTVVVLKKDINQTA